MAEATTTYAVVTGANKGIGFAVCNQLASKGITVVLTARDEKRGLEAVEKLKHLSLPGLVVFHQLDVIDAASIRSFVDFIKNQFGKLDILVNNAGITGAEVDGEALVAANIEENGGQIDWSKIITQTYEQTELGIKTNYYGAKDLTEAFIPLLQLSSSPKVVNVSSSMGKLENLPNGWPKEVFSDVENLIEEKIDEVLNKFLNDFNEGSLENNGWPINNDMSTYIISKASLSAYTRVAAKKYPSICINAVCPGFVKTDINYNTGYLTPDEGAESIVNLALLHDGSPSGHFFVRSEEKPF
ncbi:putative oxidoreductase [Medicago truncatula]|uniref:Short-chain dehydrogenase/reductase n=1 Tax=Medicago truncatula TaxID=3880 RepID=A0A396GHX3_MEDTR|nr:(+)-neomenthol dehydrogenase [Medicago truncatula]RHN39968.1 putative oxidoreductase [Medicago truncatula]